MAATSLENSYDGLAPFTWPAAGKPLKTYYRIFGDLKSGLTPLVILHGGPGLCHNYLLNHSFLTSTYSIPVILYDQIGSGLSTRLPETSSAPDFWTEEIFFEQLRQLVVHLKIEKCYDVLGSSWGGMVGSAFCSTRPEGLRRLVLANAPASKSTSTANRLRYRRELPEEMQDILDRAEECGDWKGVEVGKVMDEFARRHFCNVWPLPEDLVASIHLSREDRTVVRTMGEDGKNGNPFESVPDSYMAKWTIGGRAKNITAPTLVVNGIQEVASGDASKPFLEDISEVSLVTLEGTTHSPHLERKEEYMRVVGQFLASE